MKIVLQKFIAESGYTSRRKAEEMIRFREVKVNGKIAELGMRVDNEDEVEINGEILESKKENIYIALNKPKGYTCTSRKFRGEDNVFDLVRVKERLFVVGRLDKDSRGLVILTNDGDWTQKVTHPKYEHKKIYVVTVQGSIDDDQKKEIIKSCRKGVDIGEGDGVVKIKNIKYIEDSRFEMVLTEGKKRQIRRMFGALDYRVTDLIRVQIGDIGLEDLREGEWERIRINK